MDEDCSGKHVEKVGALINRDLSNWMPIALSMELTKCRSGTTNQAMSMTEWKQLFGYVSCVVGLLILPCSFVGCTPLDDYINKPDANYRWHDTGGRLKGRFITGSWEGVVVNMTSQAWLSSSKVDLPIWTHNLVIVTPKKIEYETACFLIGGDSNFHGPPTATDELLLLAAALAVKTKTLAAVVYQVPNQPLHFSGDEGHSPRSEDDIIAYTWARFMEDTRRVEWPLHVPMTMAAVRALDTIQAYALRQLNLQRWNPLLLEVPVNGAGQHG